jgi:hypothetical protein
VAKSCVSMRGPRCVVSEGLAVCTAWRPASALPVKAKALFKQWYDLRVTSWTRRCPRDDMDVTHCSGVTRGGFSTAYARFTVPIICLTNVWRQRVRRRAACHPGQIL